MSIAQPFHNSFGQPWRKLSLAVVVALATIWGASNHAAAQHATLSEPKPMPEITMEHLDGGSSQLADYRGQVVVLNFFATWCAPCKAEMPALDRLQAKVADKPITVIALSVDRAGPDKVRRWMDDLGVEHLTTLRDPTMAAMRSTQAPGLPATFIIDTKGQERGRVYGVEEWDAEPVVNMLTALVDEGA